MRMRLSFEWMAMAIFCLGCAGCAMTDEEYTQWKVYMEKEKRYLEDKILHEEKQIAELEKIHKAKEEDIRYLTEACEKHMAENEKLSRMALHHATDYRNVITGVVTHTQEEQRQFNDVQVGHQPQELTNSWKRQNYSIIVDMSRPDSEEWNVKSVEIYALPSATPQAPSWIQVAVYGQRIDKKSWFVKGLSERLLIRNNGLNTFNLENARLVVERGDYCGIIVSPQTRLYCNVHNVAKQTVIQMADIRNLQEKPLPSLEEALESNRGNYGGNLEFSFRLSGSTVPQNLLCASKTEVKVGQTVKTLVVKAKSKDLVEMSLTGYVAILKPEIINQWTFYKIRDISKSMIIPITTEQRVQIAATNQDGLAIKPGDRFAIIFTSDIEHSDISFYNKNFSKLYQKFNPNDTGLLVDFSKAMPETDTARPIMSVDFSLE